MSTDVQQSALDEAISELTEIVGQPMSWSKVELEIAHRQLDLLERARVQDRVMAEKIAESFGFRMAG
jgi:hypothetical protein